MYRYCRSFYFIMISIDYISHPRSTNYLQNALLFETVLAMKLCPAHPIFGGSFIKNRQSTYSSVFFEAYTFHQVSKTRVLFFFLGFRSSEFHDSAIIFLIYILVLFFNQLVITINSIMSRNPDKLNFGCFYLTDLLFHNWFLCSPTVRHKSMQLCTFTLGFPQQVL